MARINQNNIIEYARITNIAYHIVLESERVENVDTCLPVVGLNIAPMDVNVTLKSSSSKLANCGWPPFS